MKAIKILLVLILCTVILSELSFSKDAFYKVSANGNTECIKYNSLAELSNNFLITSNSAGTKFLFNNRIYYYKSLQEALDNLSILTVYELIKPINRTQHYDLLVEKFDCSVFPNPCTTSLSIVFPKNGNYILILRNELQIPLVIHSVNVEGREPIKLNLSNLASQTIFLNLSIFNNNQLVYNTNVIKQ